MIKWVRKLGVRLTGSVFQNSTRALDMQILRTKMLDAESVSEWSEKEKSLFAQMKTLREELSSLLGNVNSCASCSSNCPLPHGQWPGGFCCSTRTEDIFDDSEIAFLIGSGLQGKHLKAPRSDQAGCVFRGANGCSLPSEYRPMKCHAYLCRELTEELYHRGDYTQIGPLAEQLDALYREFDQLRRARTTQKEELNWEREWLKPD